LIRGVCVAIAIALLTGLPAVSQVSQSQMTPRLQELLKARQFTEAEQIIRAQLMSSPDWEAGHLLLAQIYTQAGKYDLAEQSAAAAVRVRESADGYMLLAVATMRLTRLNDSIGWLEKAARRYPDYPEIYRLLGLDYALGGALREAETAFRKAVQLAPDSWEHYYFLGRTVFELGRVDEALPVLQRAVRLNDASVKAWTALGQVQERVGTDAAAEASYRKAVELCGDGPECAWPLLQIGYRYSKQAKFSDALPYFRRAVQVRPAWARTHFYLAKTMAELNDLAGARTELEQATSLDDSQSEYHYQLAHVYRRLGDPRNADIEFARFRSTLQGESHRAHSAEFAQP
jgi:tetratricopeptide (TPR) repeat protein